MCLSRLRKVDIAEFEVPCPDNGSLYRKLVCDDATQSWPRKDTPVGLSAYHPLTSRSQLSVDYNTQPFPVPDMFPASSSLILSPTGRLPFPKFSRGPMIKSFHQRNKLTDGQVKVCSHTFSLKEYS